MKTRDRFTELWTDDLEGELDERGLVTGMIDPDGCEQPLATDRILEGARRPRDWPRLFDPPYN